MEPATNVDAGTSLPTVWKVYAVAVVVMVHDAGVPTQMVPDVYAPPIV